jgi:hypothetical protein
MGRDRIVSARPTPAPELASGGVRGCAVVYARIPRAFLLGALLALVSLWLDAVQFSGTEPFYSQAETVQTEKLKGSTRNSSDLFNFYQSDEAAVREAFHVSGRTVMGCPGWP